MSTDTNLHAELTNLYNECKKLIETLEVDYASKLVSMEYTKTILQKNGEKEEVVNINIISLLNQILSQLELHLKLDDTSLTSVNFYSIFQSQFDLGRYQKGVDYYIQEGFGGSEVIVTDKERLQKEFTINNCMNSMSLVPINLASNAMKYMPSGQNAKVVLIKTPRRNIISISNLGPKNYEDDLDKLTEEGYRGDNDSSMAGMGLGLSQVKSIVGIHKALLDSTIDISQETKDVSIKLGDIEYTPFTVKFSYLRTALEQSNSPSTEELFNRIPLIIAHNMVDIIANLFVITEKLPGLRFKNFDKAIKNHYNNIINRFQLDVEKMQETIKMCLYVRNNYNAEKIRGNICSIDIGSFFAKELSQLCIHRYTNIQPPIIRGTSKKIDTYSAVYPAIYALCELILEKASDDTEFDIEIDDKEITVNGRNINFNEIFYDDDLYPEEEEEECHIKSCMCLDILGECDIQVEITDNKINMNYQNIN